MTQIYEYDRSKFQGFKFTFLCIGIYGKLTFYATTPQEAIDLYADMFGVQPTECKQLSKYPSAE